MEEFWKGLVYRGVDLSDRFEISNFGNMRKSTQHSKMYSKNIIKTGYYTICVSLGSRRNKLLIRYHKAVAENFINNLENKPYINHIDGNKLNNHVSNLEWCTAKENSQHAIDTGLICDFTRDKQSKSLSKLTIEEVEYIINNYKSRDKEFGSRALGRKFHINHDTVLDIVKGKSYIWAHEEIKNNEISVIA